MAVVASFMGKTNAVGGYSGSTLLGLVESAQMP